MNSSLSIWLKLRFIIATSVPFLNILYDASNGTGRFSSARDCTVEASKIIRIIRLVFFIVFTCFGVLRQAFGGNIRPKLLINGTL